MKKTIGKSPLTAYLSKTPVKKVVEVKKQVEIKPKVNPTPVKVVSKEMVAAKEEVFVAPTVQEERQIKQRVTIHIPVNLTERIKNAVYWEPGLTVAGFCEQALLKAIEKLEKEKGQPYPSRKEQLRGGRPLK